jgi:hypothetical protein
MSNRNDVEQEVRDRELADKTAARLQQPPQRGRVARLVGGLARDRHSQRPGLVGEIDQIAGGDFQHVQLLIHLAVQEGSVVVGMIGRVVNGFAQVCGSPEAGIARRQAGGGCGR